MSETAENAVLEPQMSLAFSAVELEAKYFSTLEHIEKITGYAEVMGINDILFEKARSHIGIVAERLGVTPVQAALFSMMFSQYSRQFCHDDLTKLFKCSPIKLLQYMNDLEDLQRKQLLESHDMRNSPVFGIPFEVVNALRKKDVFVPEQRESLAVDAFFGCLEDLFDQCDSDEISCRILYGELELLVDNNMHLLFCQKLRSYKFSREDERLLLCFCHLFVNNHDDNIGFHDFDFLYDKRSQSRQVLRAFREGDHTLITVKMIEHGNDDGFVNRESFKLSDSAKKELLVELDLDDVKIFRKRGMLLWENITQKYLFYNPGEARSVAELGSLLREEHFGDIRRRLAESGMRQGFACLFSGVPGTGKTETAFQIARATERNIMQVDISAIKGMYVGETEKHIKAIFDNYRRAVLASEQAPILLFNEADAVIGKRIEFSASSRSVERMENTMQNIILQEIETLEGILIATTNLTVNMDTAFERRFLYRIEFEKPGPEARASIWRSMLPELDSGCTGELAVRFDLSGGQIENIARKCAVRQVLYGAVPAQAELAAFCREELSGSENSRKTIGFAAAG